MQHINPRPIRKVDAASARDIWYKESNVRAFARNTRTMLSQTVEYALRAIVTLAQNEGQPCTAQRISQITRVPGPYLSKLMQSLVRAGLVRSQRGVKGGFVLLKDPKVLAIWDVVDAVEPLKRIHECPLEIRSHGTTLCPLHRRLDETIEVVERIFRNTTIDELLGQEGSITALCETPGAIQIGSGVTKHSPKA
jgi:Rrf2 family protein